MREMLLRIFSLSKGYGGISRRPYGLAQRETTSWRGRLTEVLGADPDGEVLLCVLGETHAFHDLLHRRVVAVLQLHRAVGAVHAVDAHFLVLGHTTTRAAVTPIGLPRDGGGDVRLTGLVLACCSSFTVSSHSFCLFSSHTC